MSSINFNHSHYSKIFISLIVKMFKYIFVVLYKNNLIKYKLIYVNNVHNIIHFIFNKNYQ